MAAYRYPRPRCGRTFRDDPSGVDRADRTRRFPCKRGTDSPLLSLACGERIAPCRPPQAGDDRGLLRKLAAPVCVRGLRVRGVSAVLAAFGVQLSPMTVWRDVQEQAALTAPRRQARTARVLEMDGVDGQRGGQPRGVAAAVDMGNGRQAGAAELDARDAQAARA